MVLTSEFGIFIIYTYLYFLHSYTSFFTAVILNNDINHVNDDSSVPLSHDVKPACVNIRTQLNGIQLSVFLFIFFLSFSLILHCFL